jgi:hypothetical protein
VSAPRVCGLCGLGLAPLQTTASCPRCELRRPGESDHAFLLRRCANAIHPELATTNPRGTARLARELLYTAEREGLTYDAASVAFNLAVAAAGALGRDDLADALLALRYGAGEGGA